MLNYSRMAKKLPVSEHNFSILPIFLFILIVPNVFPANILFFFPGGNLSHKTSVWPWVLELAKRGHNVTFISPHAKTIVAHPNITDLASKPLQDMVSSVYQVDRFKERESGIEKDFDYNLITSGTCKVVAKNRDSDPVLRALFRDSSFDLVMVNSIFGECGFYVAHYFKAKTIAYSSCSFITWFYDTYGVSPEAAFVPDLIFTPDNIPLNLWDRAYNNLWTLYWSWTREKLSALLQDASKPLFPKGEELPSLYELENNVSVVLVNSHPAVDFARTLPPLFIDIGGMASIAKEKEMPKNFKDFMDNSGPGGVVLITFGSTILLNTISSRRQAIFFHLIHEFPNVRFLMRWSGPLPKFLDTPPKNLMVSDWLPQKEILGHPNLKLFITHGGASSIQEATYYGVPMIVMPLFADQDYNAYRIEAQEVGLKVEIRGLTEASLANAVDKMLKNDKYKKNMMKKSAIFRDRPMHPVDTAVFWTEFALRHDDTISTLRPMNQHLNWFQRRLLDVYLLYISIILLLLSVFLSFMRVSIGFIRFMLMGNEHKVSPKLKSNPGKKNN